MRISFLAIFAAFCAVASGQVQAIRAGHLVDVKAGKAIENAVVIVEAGRIRAVGSNLAVPKGAEVIDLGNATLLPGFIDCHTHLLHTYSPYLGDEDSLLLEAGQMSTAKRALEGAKRALEDLQAGFTTVRDVGNSGMNGAVALREAIENGWAVGPRIVACTRALSPLGGQFARLTPEAQGLVTQEYVPISGVEEARRAVRQAVYDGADCIKVIADSGSEVLSQEELEAIVQEAHRLKRKVAAHAIAEDGVWNAIRAGVDSIEHAYALTEPQAKLMAEKKIFLVPTDAPVAAYLTGLTLTAEQRQRAEYNFGWFTRHCRERLAIAMKCGVRIAAGSDSYADRKPLTRGQASRLMLQAYAESGMSPIEVIRSATQNAAELLGLDGEMGSLEPGKAADIVAVQGDPLKDSGALQKVSFVMKAGTIVKNAKIGD